MIKRIFALFGLLLASILGARANDGVFFAQGNQLIPITETDITVQKEILTINRVGKTDFVEITVYYEFFNPTGKAKTLLVGFEAASPYPYEDLGHFPEQPNIYDFKVVMNGRTLPFQVAHVSSEKLEYDMTGAAAPPYYVNGKVQGMTKKQCVDAIKETDEFYFPFEYVYHFNATFQPGLNTIQHTYRFLMSSSVDMNYTVSYVLTAACRWANHQIDDFSLNINMGDAETFALYPSFYKSAKEWTINGVGKTDVTDFGGEDNSVRFHIREGGITFHRKNFKPEGELFIFQENAFWSVYNDDGVVASDQVVEAVKNYYYDWTFIFGEVIQSTPADARILRNLPFAHHGYVFKSKDLQKYFESTNWYIPNPDYVADMTALTEKEQQWVSYWKQQ